MRRRRHGAGLSLGPDAPLVGAIDHLVLTVSDLARSLDFYARVLGCRPLLVDGLPSALLFGKSKINLHQHPSGFDPKARNPVIGGGDFCLVATVPITAVETRLAEQGVMIELGPVLRSGARGDMMSIYFRDPDANLVEVSHYL